VPVLWLNECPRGGDARPALVVYDDGTGPVNSATSGLESLSLAQEALDLLGKAVGRLEPGVVTGAGEEDDARVGQAGRVGVRVSGWDEAILRSPEDQRGHLGPG
jgi:hypothetical protein